ncbi:hypothetical protein NQ318_003900 [Aromia moschata]|uniref:Integrator complex subunit 14 C-terminal domain-containing protein n=1 Tax=Aromia moschata TaxID=1265417 RepID=A0AAV8Z9G0_9CUCU|nr:hypothetical protein NQ318_003900 [Aromia moschata]
MSSRRVHGAELNRLRKAAISLGFLDLLNGLAYIFEQECMQLPGSAHPDCALQLQNAAEQLRKTQNHDIKYVGFEFSVEKYIGTIKAKSNKTMGSNTLRIRSSLCRMCP